MKKLILTFILFSFLKLDSVSQCHFIPSTSTTLDTVIFSFSGGGFSSFGCTPIDPTFWLSGNGITVTATFVNPQSDPSFRVWGMNDDDSATVSVNGVSYPLNSTTASYGNKVICGISPGPDGVIFANGKLVGANSNSLGNYSYQDVTIHSNNVNTISVTGISGAGWGYAGVSVNCPTGIEAGIGPEKSVNIYPNPFSSSTNIVFGEIIPNAELKIYNTTGRLMYSSTITNTNSFLLNRKSLAAGIYIIQISNESKVFHHQKINIIE